LHFVLRHRVIRTLLLGMATISFFGFSVVTLMPAWAKEVLGGDARTNGWLLSARGFGSLVGAIMVASYGRKVHRGRLLTSVAFMVPLTLLLFAPVHVLSVSLVLLALTGWSVMIFMNMTNTFIQMSVPDDLRGRVMGIYTLSFFGMIPLGGLFAGAVATHVGVSLTVGCNALVVLAYAVYVRWRVPELVQLD